jgi:hypothetical protein
MTQTVAARAATMLKAPLKRSLPWVFVHRCCRSRLASRIDGVNEAYVVATFVRIRNYTTLLL